MYFLYFLSLFEHCMGESTIKFQTPHFKGTLLLDHDRIVRIDGFSETDLKQALTEELVEVTVSRNPTHIKTETNISIKSLTMESALFLDDLLKMEPDPTTLSDPIPKATLSGPNTSNAMVRRTSNLHEINIEATYPLPFVLGKPDKKILGRGVHCDVVVDSPDVSRRHCEVDFCGQTLQVKDLQSKNGTLLNGVAITTSVAKHGDVLSLGSTQYSLTVQKTLTPAGLIPILGQIKSIV
ncbi:MAG: FHA domain-containing protein [Candidatus Methylacidiphilales bacterium]